MKDAMEEHMNNMAAFHMIENCLFRAKTNRTDGQRHHLPTVVLYALHMDTK
jgi:hypothetical protein